MSWLDSITDSMDMKMSKVQETVEDRGACSAAVPGVAKSLTRLNDWTAATEFVFVSFLKNYNKTSEVRYAWGTVGTRK